MIIRVPNLEEAWHGINKAFMVGDEVIPNMFRGDVYLNLFDVVIKTETHHSGLFCLEDLAYTRKKAAHLLRSYLHPKEIEAWLTKLDMATKEYGQVDSDVILQSKRESKHGNGPCLLGFSFRSRGGPHLTIFSRSAEVPQTFGADIILASALAEMICQRLGIKDIPVTWYIASARIKSRMANLYRINVYPEPVTYADAKFQSHIDKGWQKFLVDRHPASFTKLVRLQELYQRIVVDEEPPEETTSSKGFIQEIDKYIKKGE